MKIIINFNNFKNTVIFIHGFNKDASSWNCTSNGKDINIESNLAKTRNTVMVELDDTSYSKSITEISNMIISNIDIINDKILKTAIVVVGHSFGGFYAMKLSAIYHNLFNKILLIDPCVKTESYCEYLKTTENRFSDLSDFPGSLTDHTNIHNKTIVVIHFNYVEDNIDKILFYSKLTNKNTKSKLILHNDVGHMIHWLIPGTIIQSINELIKL